MERDELRNGFDRRQRRQLDHPAAGAAASDADGRVGGRPGRRVGGGDVVGGFEHPVGVESLHAQHIQEDLPQEQGE